MPIISDLLIICYFFSEYYLKKKRKIKDLNKRLSYTLLLAMVLFSIKLPMAWLMSDAKYIPMPHKGMDNFSGREMEVMGACIWSFTYF